MYSNFLVHAVEQIGYAGAHDFAGAHDCLAPLSPVKPFLYITALRNIMDLSLLVCKARAASVLMRRIWLLVSRGVCPVG